MTEAVTIRAARAEDHERWRRLWRGYCDALGGVVPDTVTDGVWRRILAPEEPIFCLVASLPGTPIIGIANYVLHSNTWSLQMVCYLEDLFVAPEARGSGAARALIEGLVTLGKTQNWRRVYWHTHDNNYRARTLYDRVTPRTDYVRYDITL
jgi:GNAT superfamily N-acetyltransferase